MRFHPFYQSAPVVAPAFHPLVPAGSAAQSPLALVPAPLTSRGHQFREHQAQYRQPEPGAETFHSVAPVLLGTLRRLELGLCFLLLLLLDLFRITVEEHVHHDAPGLLARDVTTKAEDLTAEHPPDKADGVTRLVVRRDRDVDELEGRVRVAKRDNGDVHVARLRDRWWSSLGSVTTIKRGSLKERVM